MRFLLIYALPLLLMSLSSSVTAQADSSWTSAIIKVERLRDEIEARQNEYAHVGSMLNEIHVSEHSCSILGRMLGKAEAVRRLEISYSDREISDYDGETGVSDYDLSLAINSLDNWLHNAQRLVEATRTERIREWNLDCVGKMGILRTQRIIENSSQALFTLKQEGRVLHVLGDVESGFSTKLEDALAGAPNVTTVALGSAGGDVYEALLAGVNIRGRGLTTMLYNECLSACALVFLGGKQRQIWSPYSGLGFHRVSRGGKAVPFDDEVYRDIAAYAELMGVEPRYVLRSMFSAMPDSMHYPTSNFLCSGSIITWMQRAHRDC